MKTKYAANCFTEALFELLKEKDYKDISINDIIQKSGCSKASFYRNFLNKDQIIEQYLQKYIYPILERDFDETNFKAQMVSHFSELLKHKEKLYLIYKANQLNRLDSLFFNSSLFQIKSRNTIELKYRPYFYSGAASSFIKAWISFGFEESAQEIAELFINALYSMGKSDI